MYLPPSRTINIDYLRQVVSYEKKFFFFENMHIRRLKQLNGLHTNQIFAFFDDKQTRSYLPETFIANPRKADRQFIIDICNTLDSNRMDVLVKMAVDERNKRQRDKLGQTIKIDKRLIDAFTDPYILSSKSDKIQIRRGPWKGSALDEAASSP